MTPATITPVRGGGATFRSPDAERFYTDLWSAIADARNGRTPFEVGPFPTLSVTPPEVLAESPALRVL